MIRKMTCIARNWSLHKSALNTGPETKRCPRLTALMCFWFRTLTMTVVKSSISRRTFEKWLTFHIYLNGSNKFCHRIGYTGMSVRGGKNICCIFVAKIADTYIWKMAICLAFFNYYISSGCNFRSSYHK